MCCFHWLIKRLPWPFDRAVLRWAESTEQNAGKKGSVADAMALLSKMDAPTIQRNVLYSLGDCPDSEMSLSFLEFWKLLTSCLLR